MQKVAVVIPTHKEELNPLEKISLDRCRKVLGRYPLIFVAPAGKNFSYVAPDDKVVCFDQNFFRTLKDYNRLMKNPLFYATFKDFEYILLYELDAFVFYDALEYFCSLGYDYIGAPWPRVCRRDFGGVIAYVGNSGFCLRDVKVHYNLLVKNETLVNALQNMPNDDFFAYCGAREDINFSVPPVDIAARFSVEYVLEHSVKNLGGKLPFGVHGWTKMSADFYTKIFPNFGYDLLPFRNIMRDVDADILQGGLLNVAHRRLIRRLERGQNISRYLPPRSHYTSIRALRSPVSLMILTRLLTENPRLADEIFLYDEDDRDVLLSDLTAKREPHLLIDSGISTHDLLQAAEQRGLTYGKRVVHFWREYFDRCEKIFRNLGK